jgi:hypothetical protein
LANVRRKVTEQLGKSANYACVETLDRSYLKSTRPGAIACGAEDAADLQEVMHDRLRLNLAVSAGAEIFSWHGENKFTSSDIDKIVKAGPISSGSFVGFLRNIFLARDIRFKYRGNGTEHGVAVERFDYAVATPVSRFRVEGAQNRYATVPFHGSFSADATTFHILRLKVTAGRIPFGLNICSTDSEVHYQMANISGIPTLIPRSFELHVDDDTHLHTVSRGEYAECHEFRAESRVRFDAPQAYKQTPQETALDPWLPSGLDLHVELTTAIDEKTMFTGDTVEGVLTAPVRTEQGKLLLPANATLRGVITQLQTFYVPEAHSSLRIQFNSARFGINGYRLRAVHKLSEKERRTTLSVFDGVLTDQAKSEIEQGTIFVHSDRLRLDRRFRGDWRTALPAEGDQRNP